MREALAIWVARRPSSADVIDVLADLILTPNVSRTSGFKMNLCHRLLVRDGAPAPTATRPNDAVNAVLTTLMMYHDLLHDPHFHHGPTRFRTGGARAYP